jgi:hypothetical protein
MPMTYEAVMALGAARYADVLAALDKAGLTAVFTQTGGMCAALEITLDNGQHLLVTDGDDTLAWDRDRHAGWGVGLYPRDDDEAYDEGHLAYGSTSRSDSAALLDLVRQVLRSARWPA